MATLNEAIAKHLGWTDIRIEKVYGFSGATCNGYDPVSKQRLPLIEYDDDMNEALELLKEMDAALSYVPSTQQWQVDNYMTESPTMFTDASAARAICKAYAVANGLEYTEDEE